MKLDANIGVTSSSNMHGDLSNIHGLTRSSGSYVCLSIMSTGLDTPIDESNGVPVVGLNIGINDPMSLTATCGEEARDLNIGYIFCACRADGLTEVTGMAFIFLPYQFYYPERKLTMEEMLNKAIGYDEVIFYMDQSMKKPLTIDDECYNVDELDDTSNEETHKLLENDQLDSFLLSDMEKTIVQTDLENCSSIIDNFIDDSDIDMQYDVLIQSICANEIDEKKHELKDLPSHLEYAYLHDSSWVSLIHVVPKKGGMNVVLNDNNELLPSRTVITWRVCIKYHKVNDGTQKDHFPLPFNDQMLERLS
nr:RNA-directed DNA polymerase homolog [Tanacetum cinerariifolium]